MDLLIFVFVVLKKSKSIDTLTSSAFARLSSTQKPPFESTGSLVSAAASFVFSS